MGEFHGAWRVTTWLQWHKNLRVVYRASLSARERSPSYNPGGYLSPASCRSS